MKTKFKHLAVILTKKRLFLNLSTCVLFIFVSCNKNELNQHLAPTQHSNIGTYKSLSNGLTLSEIEEIGLIHNQILKEAFDEQVMLNNHDLKLKFLEVSIANGNYIKEQLSSNQIPEFDYTYLINHLDDQRALNYIDSARNLILNAANQNEIKQRLQVLRSAVLNDDRDFNKTVVYLFIEVCIQSSNFWSNGLASIGQTGFNQFEPISPWVKGLIAADGLGASCAFTGYGLLAGITGPMGWGGLIATVGFSAAWSSATYALM